MHHSSKNFPRTVKPRWGETESFMIFKSPLGPTSKRLICLEFRCVYPGYFRVTAVPLRFSQPQARGHPEQYSLQALSRLGFLPPQVLS